MSFEEKILFKLDNTKVTTHPVDKMLGLLETKYLVAPNNDVLVTVYKDKSSILIRFNYDIIWIPLIHNKDINLHNNVYPYLSEVTGIVFNVHKSNIQRMGGVEVKNLPYDRY